MLISATDRLSAFQTLGIGTHVFERAHTEFAATVCVPVPEIGINGFILDDGTLLTGDVWLIGTDGVVIRKTTITREVTCGSTTTYDAIRVDNERHAHHCGTRTDRASHYGDNRTHQCFKLPTKHGLFWLLRRPCRY